MLHELKVFDRKYSIVLEMTIKAHASPLSLWEFLVVHLTLYILNCQFSSAHDIFCVYNRHPVFVDQNFVDSF
jgi:hypothetical protein